MAVHDLDTDRRSLLRTTERQMIHEQLQQILVVMTDLALQGKQAHWNVTGPHFRSLHLHLDEMIDAWRDAGDRVAERSAALGFAPDGRAATVAATTPLSPLPSGPIPGRDVVAALVRLLTASVSEIRDRMMRLEGLDPVTADLLHGVVATLEEQLWMVRVQAD